MQIGGPARGHALLRTRYSPDGTATRNFQNFHHHEILPQDYVGSRAIVGNRYKLVVDGTQGSGRELFDLRADPAEKNNLIATHAARLGR